jgi:hypothetical protein
MKRREFIALIGGTAAACSGSLSAGANDITPTGGR